MALALSPLADAMPSESDLKEAKPIVDALISDDMRALKAKKKSPKDVASAMLALADKAESEAGKFLLMHKAFCVSARNNMDDYAAYVLNRMRSEIADVSAEYIVDLVNKEMRNVSATKSPKVLAIYSEEKRTVDLRKRLSFVTSKLRKEPDDKVLLRQQAEILASLGNWTRALEIYAKIGTKAAQYELDPQSVEDYDVFIAADFWWNYKATHEEPFKAHAAALYRVALDKDIATGLRREIALKRMKEVKSLGEKDVHSSGGGVAIKKAVEAKPSGHYKTGDAKTITLPGGEKMEMIYCASGEYVYGQDNVQVRMSHGFWLGKYEVTQKQWKSVMRGTKVENPFRWKGDSLPAETVSWDECQDFIRKVNEELKCGARLPAEHEWEYACRAGAKTYDFRAADSTMWYIRNSGQRTHAVGQKTPNDWGFYDMIGNVWEWCDYKGLFRGGSWRHDVNKCNPWWRIVLDGKHYPLNIGYEDVGFRLCISAE